MGKCKRKVIQTDLGTIRHIQELFRLTQAYSEPCVTLAYLKSWYILNDDIFRTRSIFRTLAYHNPGTFRTPVYSERWHIQNPRHIQNPVKRFAKIANGYNDFRKL